MDHSVADLDPCRESVEDEAANLVLENRYEIGKLMEILLGSVNRRGEVAFERAGDLKQLIPGRVTYQKRGGAKNLSVQVRSQECNGVGFKKRGGYGKPGLRIGARSFGDEGHGRIGFSRSQRRIIRRMNDPGEQVEGRRARDQLS